MTYKPNTSSRQALTPKLINTMPSSQPEVTSEAFGALPPSQARGDVPPDLPKPILTS